jgi:hypothetical protein
MLISKGRIIVTENFILTIRQQKIIVYQIKIVTAHTNILCLKKY